MKNIIIFGATGSIGAYTSIYLKQKGYNVYAVGKRASDNNFFSINGISYISCDVRNKSDFVRLPHCIDCIIHLAGAMPAHMAGYNPNEYIDSIITGTLNILEYAKNNKCKQIIFSQSISDILYLFGSTEPIPADVERRFPLIGDHSVYSIAKNAAVNLIEHYYAEFGIRRFILRLPTIYLYHPNPYYYINGEKKWLAYRYIIDQAIKGNTLQIWGNPNSMKEMVYIKDLTQLIELCVVANCEGGMYNVGCGSPVSIEYQIKTIAEVFANDKRSLIEYCPQKPSSPHFILDITKTERELGYHPVYSFKKLLIDFKKEMEEEPYSILWGKKDDYNE